MRGCSLLIQLFLVGWVVTASAQFGNEWINYNQTYYKISVIKKGIHRLTYSDLAAAGVPVNAIDPRRIQIFRRGVEQAINLPLSFQANAQFEPGEYLEFYGEKNDGATDVDLYKNPAHHPHPYYNLYSDTAVYFLTWNLLPVQGRRMPQLNPEINVGSLPAEPGHTSTALQVLSDEYSAGVTYVNKVQNSFFDEGEGWTGPLICTLTSGCTGQQDFVIDVPRGVASLNPPQLEVLLAGRFEVGHSVEIYVGQNSASLRLLSTSSFQNFKVVKVTSPLVWSDVSGSGTVTVRVKGLGVGGALERVSVSYIKVDYPHDFNFSGLNSHSIQLFPNAGNKSYIEIQNGATGLRLFDITDLTAGYIIGTYAAGLNLAAIINGTNLPRKLFASAEFFTPAIKKVSFRSITPSAHNYLIITNSVLRKPGLGYSDPVKAYSDYRGSTIGGGFDTLLVNIDQLYNQFNYGETSSRAVYQFMKFMANGGTPKYLFLVGKGMEINFTYDRKRVFLPTDLKDLVPTGGYPGSDLVYSAGLKGTTYEPAISTGRLVANSPTEVAAYLNKVKETDLLPYDDLWRKNILHLSGGISPGEPERFKNYVDGFKTIAEDLYLGAQVSTKSKRTLDVGETVPISDQVNAGLSLITFFGHSSTTTLDFDIGFVTNPILNYNNPGKYPAFIINGCNVGRIYSNAKYFGEDWITAQNKGAKGFIAHSSFGFETSLHQYTDQFYRSAFADTVGFTLGIGDVQKEVAKQILTFGGPSTNTLSIMYQMVLNGDPAVKVFGALKPDYAIKDEFLSKVSFDGKPITAATKLFGIQYKIRNYGQAGDDSIKISLTRTLPDNSILKYDTIVPPVFYENEFIFIVPNSGNDGGESSFQIEIDELNEIAELNENNNIAQINLFIPSSSTYNLVPYHYAVVNSTSVELIFQNTNQLPAYREYQLELDTVPSFNSLFLLKRKISANVLVRTTVTIPAKDSTVFYWRTRLSQPTPDESTDWFTTSFSHISGSGPGWAQLRYPQFTANNFFDLEQNSITGKLEFPERVSTVFVKNFGSANPAPYTDTSIKVNNEELNISTQGQPCRVNTLNIVAFDKATGTTYAGIPFNFQDQRTCGREPQVINSFTLAEAELSTDGLAQAITNIAVNDSVVFFTIGDGGLQSYSASLLAKLEEVGISATQLAGFQAGEPLIAFGKKGVAPGGAKVIRASTVPLNQQELVANETITSHSNTGSVSSPWIGPAKEWYYMNQQLKEVEISDIVSIKVIGLTDDNQEVLLYEGNDSFVNFAFIDPVLYPLIKLQLNTTDETNLTPVDLKNWVVHYAPVAEGILLYRGNPAALELQEGENWTGKYSFINLSDRDFTFNGAGEKLDVELKIVNESLVNIESIEIDAPLPKDSTVFVWEVKTEGIPGVNNISVKVNAQQVREQYFFNDEIILEDFLKVQPDLQPPVLDVTVDGRYLVNGDLVSHRPTVKILLIDENGFLFKTDTSDIQIFIRDLVEGSSRRINFSDSDLTWLPATAQSHFQIIFQTDLNAGEYELYVQASDASSNSSGDTPYSVTFFISDEESVQLGEPFPNPSAAAFSFPIRLSGNELPESMSLKIFSPDGRLLHHFGLDDVSGFFVGTNYLVWDPQNSNGTDVPNGLYYFKLELTVSGKIYTKTGRLVLIGP